MTGKLRHCGLDIHFRAWNHHRIPGKICVLCTPTRTFRCDIEACFHLNINNAGPHLGIPNMLAECSNHTAQVFSIPMTEEAVSYYIAAGGHLTSTTQVRSLIHVA